MGMTTRGSVDTNKRDCGPEGAATVLTEDSGAPSMDKSPSTQSPASLQGKMTTVAPAASMNTGASKQSPASLQGHVVATCDGSK